MSTLLASKGQLAAESTECCFCLYVTKTTTTITKKKQTKKQKDLTNIQFQLDWPRNSFVIQRFNIVPSLCANPQKMICSEWESIMNRKFRKIFEKKRYINASLIVSLNTQSCSTHPQMVNRGLSRYNTENLTWTIVRNVFGECHTRSMLKKSFVDFKKEYVLQKNWNCCSYPNVV